MKIYLKKYNNGLIPSDEDSLEKIKKLSKDKSYFVNIRIARNYRFLKKYMAMIKIGAENTKITNARTNEPITKDSYRKLMQIRAGYYKVYSTEKGNYIESDSIAFDKMDEEQFRHVYQDVKSQVAADVGITSEELEMEILIRF